MEYEANNSAVDDQTGGVGIMCKNFILCETVLPEWWFDCKGRYLCTNCHMLFGTWGTHTGRGILDVVEDVECPVCLEVKRSVLQPNCEHTMCIDCFKRCRYGAETVGPEFPRPDIEDEYDDDTDNPKWEDDYPSIKKYHQEYNKWDDEQKREYQREKKLAIYEP